MKSYFYFLLAVACVFFLWGSKHAREPGLSAVLSKGTMAAPSGSAPGAVLAHGALTPVPSTTATNLGTPPMALPPLAAQERERREKRQALAVEFRQALFSLADEMDRTDYKLEELVRLTGPESGSPSGGIKSLPPSLQGPVSKYIQVIEKMQDQQLSEDGYTRNFFTKKTTPVPAMVEKRLEALKGVALAERVRKFVEARAKSAEILDEDLRKLGELCEKNRDCVEKSVVSWMDANHLLDEEQFKILREVTM